MKNAETRAERKRAKRLKKDVRKLKTISPITSLVPFIMVNRTGSSNLMTDSVPSYEVDQYLKDLKKEGMENITFMHVLVAAYVRLCSQRPAINRFIRGQRIWTRRSIEVSLTIKKDMTLESPDTVVKIVFQPTDTIKDVYEKLNAEIEKYRASEEDDVIDTANWFCHIPAPILKFVIWLLKTLDYFRLIPKFLLKVSPFHCSVYFTSIASLGIPPIFHHLYDFGTCPLFVAFGTKSREVKVREDGSIYKEQRLRFTFNCDERIVDGYYYASALKYFKNILKNPRILSEAPETVVEDID